MLYENVQRGISTALMERPWVDLGSGIITEPSVINAGLSDRQSIILDLVSRGVSHMGIVEYFGSTPGSIYNDRSEIIQRSGARNFPHAVSTGCRENVFEPILTDDEALRIRRLSICLRESIFLAARGLSLVESAMATKMPTSEGNMGVRRTRATRATGASDISEAVRRVFEAEAI